jgi:uncharacterized small protein (DUF1192 family)
VKKTLSQRLKDAEKQIADLKSEIGRLTFERDVERRTREAVDHACTLMVGELNHLRALAPK